MRFQKVAFALFLLSFACSKDNDTIVPSAFSDYVDRFVAEGKARNTKINTHNLNVAFVDESVLPGYCGQGQQDPPRIQITNTDNCWNQRSDTDKEILIFHEMGHAILGRLHINDTLPNGDYKSMMFGGNQFNVYNIHTPEKRQYYLDELFNTATATPDWAKKKTQLVEIFTDSITTRSNWVFRTNGDSEDQGTISTVFSSQGHSLSITSSSTSTGFSYWSYFFRPSQIPVGSKLILKVKVKLDDLTGNGAYIAMRGDAESDNAFFVTTQGVQRIAGSQEFKEYTIKLNYLPQDVLGITIFLILNETSTGTTYFDDVSLISYR